MAARFSFVVALCVTAFVGNVVHCSPEKCKSAPDGSALSRMCIIQTELEAMQAVLDRVQTNVDKLLLSDSDIAQIEKRKNEFVRFGRGDIEGVEKRKNEFVRFGRNDNYVEGENAENDIEKRKNEFVRFGRMSADKRKNEFVRFGKKSTNDEIVEEKRKNEFVRFG